MLFVDAIEEVISITKRPDKRAETISNLNKAIAFYTLKADWKQDLVETTLNLDPTLNGQTIDLLDYNDILRFRKVKFLRPTTRRYYLNYIDPTQMLGPNGNVQTDRFYVAGSLITVALSQLDSTLEFGYYTYAPILEETPTPPDTNLHWMLDIMPWAITERAASQIFKSIGDDNSTRFYEGTSNEFFLAAKRDFEDQVADFAR